MVQKDGQWIKVEDRLPDFETKVLVFYRISKEGEGYVEIGKLRSITTSANHVSYEWTDKGYDSIPDPSHWMPLPEPPATS